MAYRGQEKVAWDTGYQDALYGRPRENPYNQDTVPGSWHAYEEGYDEGLGSTDPPRGLPGVQGDPGPPGPTGPTGSTGTAGSNGADGNRTYVVTGVPAPGLGIDGDVAIAADDGDVWWKIAGTWVNQGGFGNVAQATEIDFVSELVFYTGKADPGTITSAASWRISKSTLGNDDDLTVIWADGDDAYDNIWDDRLSLSYS